MEEMNSHVISHYFKVHGHMNDQAMGDASNHPPLGDVTLTTNKPDRPNKHSYFLRAKTPRFVGYRDEEFKNSSSFDKKMALEEERVISPLFSSPKQSRESKSEHLDDQQNSASSEEEDLANCLVMLSNKSYASSSDEHKEEKKAKQMVEKGMFQCKACKKIFNSHQALGGHRASHKKVKGCFAAKMDDGHVNDEEHVDNDSIQEVHDPLTPSSASDQTQPVSTRKKPKMHECSVCRRVFSSGQALGGHKRCHWLTTSTDNAFIPSFQDFQFDHQNQQLCKNPMFTNPYNDQNDQDHQLDLNLNLPAHADDKFTSRFEASTRFYLQQQLATTNHIQQSNPGTADHHVEEGREMKKLRKLSDLRDVKYDGGWLQMGIASTAAYI